MVVHLSIEELGRSLDEIIFRRVAAGERFLIHLDGEPAAYLLNPDDPLRHLLDPNVATEGDG